MRVVFGRYQGPDSTVEPQANFPTDATLLDVSLKAGQDFAYDIAEGYNAFAAVIRGSVIVEGAEITKGKAFSLGREGGHVSAVASNDSQIALFIGKPINEPVMRHGPFAMTNQADLDKAVADYQAGRMGHLS